MEHFFWLLLSLLLLLLFKLFYFPFFWGGGALVEDRPRSSAIFETNFILFFSFRDCQPHHPPLFFKKKGRNNQKENPILKSESKSRTTIGRSNQKKKWRIDRKKKWKKKRKTHTHTPQSFSQED